MASSTKTKPKLWKRIVASVKAGSKGGRKGVWSGRKAQLAVARYKKAGGGYRGGKSSKNSFSSTLVSCLNGSNNSFPKFRFSFCRRCH